MSVDHMKHTPTPSPSTQHILLSPVQGDLLLLEIPPVLLVYQNQIKEILDAEFVVDVAIRRSEVVGAEEQTDGNAFACMKAER